MSDLDVLDNFSFSKTNCDMDDFPPHFFYPPDGNVLVESLGLVHGKPDLLRVATREIGDVFVGRRDTGSPVDEYDCDVGFLDLYAQARALATLDRPRIPQEPLTSAFKFSMTAGTWMMKKVP